MKILMLLNWLVRSLSPSVGDSDVYRVDEKKYVLCDKFVTTGHKNTAWSFNMAITQHCCTSKNVKVRGEKKQSSQKPHFANHRLKQTTGLEGPKVSGTDNNWLQARVSWVDRKSVWVSWVCKIIYYLKKSNFFIHLSTIRAINRYIYVFTYHSIYVVDNCQNYLVFCFSNECQLPYSIFES